jgi:hypothetical protein
MLIFCTYNPSWALSLRTVVRSERSCKGITSRGILHTAAERWGSKRSNSDNMRTALAQNLDTNRQYSMLSYKTHT